MVVFYSLSAHTPPLFEERHWTLKASLLRISYLFIRGVLNINVIATVGLRVNRQIPNP